MLNFQLRIPKEAIPGFAALMQLDDSAFDELLASLAGATPGLDREVFLHRIVAESDLNRESVRAILDSLLSLFSILTISEIDTEELIEELCRAINGVDELKELNRDSMTTKSRLSMLLSTDSVSTIGKAMSVVAESERVFYHGRILTDVRPVFRGTSVELSAAAVIHSLKIVFLQDRELREFYVAMDEEDLAQLRKAVDRAILKSATLEDVLGGAGITSLTKRRNRETRSDD